MEEKGKGKGAWFGGRSGEDSFSQSVSAPILLYSLVMQILRRGEISKGGSRSLRRSTHLLRCSPSPSGHACTHVCVRYAGNIKYGVEQRKGERDNNEGRR